jgi:hypothetical protein
MGIRKGVNCLKTAQPLAKGGGSDCAGGCCRDRRLVIREFLATIPGPSATGAVPAGKLGQKNVIDDVDDAVAARDVPGDELGVIDMEFT